MSAIVLADAVTRAGQRAVQDQAFAGALLELVQAPTTAAGTYSRPAADALNRARRADARSEFLAAALDTAAVQHLLGLRTPQAVHRLRSRGKLLGRQIGNATWFPAWQFGDGARRDDLDELLTLLTRFSTDAIAADRVMRLQRDELSGASIAESLDRPRKAATARAILAALAG